jgi:hypothetical protein
MPSGFGTCVNNESVTAAAQADTDYATLRGDLFKAAGLAGEGDAVWQAFILGGEAYRDHVAAHDYPSDGDTCLYCQQVLGPEALTLLRRYRAFANDAARERAAAARRIATTLSRNVAAIDQAITRQEVLRHPRSLLNPPDDTPFVRQPHAKGTLSCAPAIGSDDTRARLDGWRGRAQRIGMRTVPIAKAITAAVEIPAVAGPRLRATRRAWSMGPL